MRPRAILLPLISVTAVALSGCITEKTLLTNDQGQTLTCEHKGHVGIVSPIRVYVQQHNCIKDAEASGYKEQPPAKSS